MTDKIISCPQCGFPRIRDVGNGLYQCDDCGTHFDKDENVVLTNEEWFCNLSTEEKAKWMFRLTYKCYWCGREYEKTKKYNEKECPFQKCLDDSKGFKKWLKEIHNEQS